ncbi:hypothetical protein GW17_00006148 [Ensete ventricosum]|nr:hypothetical protein GW17_00006148 [Ensete ventricosum]
MCTSGRNPSNLQSFLAHVTPSVPAYPLPKVRFLYPLGFDSCEKAEYFTLGDLWEQYSEWSAYGAAVPIILDNHETVLQMLLEESESESFSDDSESDKMSKSWDALSEDSMISQDSSLPGKEILDNVVPGDSAKDYYCPMVAKTNKWEQKKGSNSVTLSPFGLSTYKMQEGRIWRNPDTSDTEMMDNLYNAAQSWLMQLRVEHHDFEFFATH